MKLQALLFTLHSRRDRPFACALDENYLRRVKQDAEAQPVAFVVRENDLGVLREMTDLVAWCGRKEPHQAPSALLFGQSKIAAISGSYVQPGQTARSIRRLIENANTPRKRNVFIIGVSHGVFEELRAKAAALPAGGDGLSAFADGGANGPEAELGFYSVLVDPEHERDVPKELVNSFVGSSPAVRAIRQVILRVADTDDVVVIAGESGTGKDIVARAIHDQGPRRRTESFIPVNCAGIPPGLLESELFGHVKGAFTDARTDKKGLWVKADKGTLFLDEVGDLPLHQQAKVLRALDHDEVWPVGAEEPVRVDVRVVAATNRNLRAMVESGQFRRDLYHRLVEVMISIPPLRDRRQDIPLLAAHFWEGITDGKGPELAPEVMEELKAYPWVGNAREVRSVLLNVRRVSEGKAPTVRQVREVIQNPPPWPMDPPTGMAQAAELRHLECSQHIRQADDAVRASKVSLRPFIRGGASDADAIERVRGKLRPWLEELERLCLHPIRFHTEDTFTAVAELKGDLMRFDELLASDPDKARAFWNTLFEQFKKAEHAIFEENARLDAGP